MSAKRKLGMNVEDAPKETASGGKGNVAVFRQTITQATERNSLNQHCATFDYVLEIHVRVSRLTVNVLRRAQPI